MNEELKKQLDKSTLVDYKRDSNGINVTLSLGKGEGYTNIYFTKDCIVFNKRWNEPVSCEKTSKSIPGKIRDFIKKNEIKNPNKFFELKKKK
jgi:hypothetical protein